MSDFQFFASVAIGWIFHAVWVAMRRMVTEIEAEPVWKDPTDTPYN
jgi:hypothetical protein